MPNATKRRRSRSSEPYSPNNAIPEVPANADGQAEPSPKRPRRRAAWTRARLVEADGEEAEEELKPKRRGRLMSKSGKAAMTKAEKLKGKDEKRKDYLPPPEPPYLHDGLAGGSPDPVDHVGVAHGLANGHPEQANGEKHNYLALDASIDPALQSCAAGLVAGAHHFDRYSMSGHPPALSDTVTSVEHSQMSDSADGVQGVAHYPNGTLATHPGNPQAKPLQSPWPDLPIRPPWVCPYPLCDRQGKPFAQKSALERHIKSQHLGIRGTFAILIVERPPPSPMDLSLVILTILLPPDHVCDLCGSAFSRADVLKAKHRPICKGVPQESPGSNKKNKKRKASAIDVPVASHPEPEIAATAEGA